MKFALICLLFFSAVTNAQVISQRIDYLDQDRELQGTLYWDKGIKDKRPGILVYPEWWGLNAFVHKRARMLAEMGYVVFAADMYGKQRVTKKAIHAKVWMKQVTKDPQLWIQRANTALDQLKGISHVDANRIAAIGYSFGGGTVLQMAYAGLDLKGVVSFYGSLPAAPEESKGKIMADILVLHGEDDSIVPPEMLTYFKEKLIAAQAKWTIVRYQGIKHGFTDPNAARYGIDGLQYHAGADRDSWRRMRDFLKKIFQKAEARLADDDNPNAMSASSPDQQ